MQAIYYVISFVLFGYMLFMTPFALAAPKPGIWMGKTDQKGLFAFIVSEDGMAVNSFEVRLAVECANGERLFLRTFIEQRIPIRADDFTVVAEKWTYKGKFTSPTTANGTWTYEALRPVEGVCKGAGIWSATAGGYSLELDGVDDYAQAPDSVSLNVGDEPSESLTIEAWIYPRRWPRAYASIAEKPGSYALGLEYDSSDPQRPQGFTFITSDRVDSVYFSELPVNQWYHLAGVFNNTTNTIALYINGVEYVADEPFTGNLPGSTSDFLVGKTTLVNEYFPGGIDELRISGAPRYKGNFDLPTERFTPDPDTRALWHFDEPLDKTSFSDASGNKNPLIYVSGSGGTTEKRVPLQLLKGINVISVPLDPGKPWKLSDLSRFIGDKVITVVWYNSSDEEFIAYMPDFPETSPANKAVKAGEGYIVVMDASLNVVFTGKAWDTPPAAPPFVDALNIKSILVVKGAVGPDRAGTANGFEVSIRNANANVVKKDVTGSTAGDGRYVVAFVDFAGKRAAKVGDVLEIAIRDTLGNLGRESFVYTVESSDVDNYVADLPNVFLSPIPKQTMLLRNYPNPFNPETWIPYQLAENVDVNISIYDVTGRLIRRLELGYKDAGIYHSKAKAAYWDGRNAFSEEPASGIYFYTMQAGSFSATRKLLMLK